MQQEYVKIITAKKWAITPVSYIKENGLCSCLDYKEDCTCQGKHAVMGAWQKNIITNISDIKTIWNDKCWYQYKNKDGETKHLKGNSQYNVGLLTGEINDILVIDIDQHGIDGEESIKELESELGPLGDTVESLTGGGGRQLFFKYPKDYIIRNGVGIAPGVDIRSNGGYVLIEPSITKRAYAWNAEFHPEEMEMLELPLPWLNYIVNQQLPNNKKSTTSIDHKVKKYTTGGRNNCMFKLGSSYRANGMSDKALLSTLLIENQERCEPPLTEDEINIIVNSIKSYEIGDINVKEIEEEQEPITIVPSTQHFGELPKGFLTDLVEFYMKCTDSERDFIIASALHSVSMALNKRVGILFGNGVVYPLMYQVLLAKSGLFRKSTSLNLTRNLLRAAKCDDLIASDMSSQETFLEVLSTSPNKLIIKNEISEMLLSFEKNYMRGFKEFLIDSYDLPPRIIKNKKNTKGKLQTIIIDDAYVSIFGASVEETFMQFLTENDMLGGFLPRFLYVVCRERTRDIIHYPTSSPAFPENLIKSFNKLRNIKSVKIDLRDTPKILEMYVDWCEKIYTDTQNSNNLVLESFATRYVVYLLKLSIMFEAVKTIENNKDYIIEISQESMGYAINFMNVYWANAKNLVLGGNFTFTQYDKEKKKIIDIIKSNKSKNKVTTRRTLLYRLHMKKADLVPILDTLEEAGYISIDFNAKTKSYIINLL